MKLFKFVTLLFAPLLLLGCKDKSSNQEETKKDEKVYLTLSHTSIYLSEDTSFQLEVTIDDSLKQNLVFWDIRDEDIASVEDGLVTAKKVGSTICTVQVGVYTAKCAVNVTDYEPEAALSINLEKTTFNLSLDETYELDLEVKLGNDLVSDYVLTNEVGNANIVSMTNNIITPLNTGNTDILLTVTYQEYVAKEVIYITVY